jgi:hypothetical protein
MSARPASLLPSSPDEPKVFTASKKTLSGSYQRQYDDQLEISRSHDHRHFEYLPIGGDLLGSDRIVRERERFISPKGRVWMALRAISGR